MTQLNLINLKNVFVYEIGLIAIREVSSPFDEEQQYGRPYQPKHSPSCVASSRRRQQRQAKTRRDRLVVIVCKAT